MMEYKDIKKAIAKKDMLKEVNVSYGEYESSADGSIEYDVNINCWYGWGDFDSFTYKTCEDEKSAEKNAKYVFRLLNKAFYGKVRYEGWEL